MNILDYCMIIIICLGALQGYRKGLISAGISLIGTLFCVILAYYLKNPVSSILYDILPFSSFSGFLSGISSFNILLYEGISYLISVSFLLGILKVILKLTKLVDTVVKMTVILALPSKLLGLLCGALEYFIFAFAISLVVGVIPSTTKLYNESYITINVVSSTPILSSITNSTTSSLKEIYDVVESSKNNRSEADYKSLDILLKYNIISPATAEKLVEKDKLKIENANTLIEKYKNGNNINNQIQEKVDNKVNNVIEGVLND